MQIEKIKYILNLGIGIGRAGIRKCIGRTKYKRKYYNGKKILTNEQANELLRKKIEGGKPFMVARFGDGELRTVVYYLERKYGIRKRYPDYIKLAIGRNAGFFPISNENMDQFGKLMLDSCKRVDILAVWFNLLEDYIYSTYGPKDETCIYLKALEPFWYDNPWSSALKNKRVLVIHPFAETIEKQYEKRKKLYKNEKILPDFELLTLKAVQSIGGKSDKYETWFEALEAMKINFDIAIIGCGAYGFPLGAKLKDSGKMVIHMGGVTQFLFGIKGNRWDERPEYKAFYNEAWVRPSDFDKPEQANEIENSCYW